VRKLQGCLLHEALAALWEFVGAGNRFVEAEQPWAIARAVKAGEEGAAERLRLVLETSWRHAGWWPSPSRQ